MKTSAVDSLNHAGLSLSPATRPATRALFLMCSIFSSVLTDTGGRSYCEKNSLKCYYCRGNNKFVSTSVSLENNSVRDVAFGSLSSEEQGSLNGEEEQPFEDVLVGYREKSQMYLDT